jgi:hypothetical protein
MSIRWLITVSVLALGIATLSGCSAVTEYENTAIVGSPIQNNSVDQFTGTVTGYGVDTQGYGGDDQNTIYVDNKRVDLDLIWPYSASCMERELVQDKAFSSARDALEKTLPIGQRVLVVWSNYENGEWVGDQSKGFIHILESGDSLKVSPPADSANERLILTGYWVPHGMGIDFDSYDFNAKYVVSSPDYLSQTQERYIPYLFEAGDKARTAQAGALGVCSVLALDYEIDSFYIGVSFSRNDEEKRRLLQIERNKPVYCRDGDGDGICFED